MITLDWGLRAIKSVLVLAGTAKRNNHIHNLSEEQLLLGEPFFEAPNKFGLDVFIIILICEMYVYLICSPS